MSTLQELRGKHLVVGLSGGVACYKTAELVRLLVQAGATIQVVMTEAATRFVAPLTFQALSGRPVVVSTWHDLEGDGMPHIHVTRQADAVVIAPASADVIAALAQGRADDVLSLLCLARPSTTLRGDAGPCPVLLAPAMNREMWAHPATQRNVAQVRSDGAVVLGPGHGAQACGEWGDGRMLEPGELLAAVIGQFQPQVLQGHRVLITAGPTVEAIDPVRGLSNRSSGKMGFAVARAARDAGAIVTLVAGPVALPTPFGVERVDVQSAQDMLDAVLPRALDHDVFIATAAVADWRPAQIQAQKIKKIQALGQGKMTLDLIENPDILATVAALPDAPWCVGFAAESEHLATHARAKLISKRVPLVVGNVGPSAFGQDDNALLLVDQHGDQPLPPEGTTAHKLTLARALVAEIAHRLRLRSDVKS